MNWINRWNSYSLATQFLVAGGAVSIIAMVGVGFFVTHLIEKAVIHNSAAATALYVDSVVAPLLPDMQKAAFLDDATARALDETLDNGALGRRLVSFKLWRPDGAILYSNEKELVGKKFGIDAKLRDAFAGSLVARYGPAADPESMRERQTGKPLLEIYNPVLQPWSGQVVAVVEFYEVADGFEQSLADARLESWLAVTGFTAAFFLILSAIVFRGSRMIETQRGDLNLRIQELSDLLTENRSLQRRLQRASQRAAALNETYLRRIGADLHDGPAQHIAYASLRLDSDILVNPATPGQTREKEIDWIRSSLAEAMAEIRSICSGLVLPQIEQASLREIVRRAVDAHEQRTKTEVETVFEGDDADPSPAVKICAYRFVQEALNNAYRHGGGIEQKVRTASSNGSIEVEVSDHGDGFNPGDIRPSSLGLAGLRERIDSLGGTFEVQSSCSGTTLTMKFQPMETEDRQ